jgi:hypothetical protein
MSTAKTNSDFLKYEQLAKEWKQFDELSEDSKKILTQFIDLVHEKTNYADKDKSINYNLLKKCIGEYTVAQINGALYKLKFFREREFMEVLKQDRFDCSKKFPENYQMRHKWSYKIRSMRRLPNVSLEYIIEKSSEEDLEKAKDLLVYYDLIKKENHEKPYENMSEFSFNRDIVTPSKKNKSSNKEKIDVDKSPEEQKVEDMEVEEQEESDDKKEDDALEEPVDQSFPMQWGEVTDLEKAKDQDDEPEQQNDEPDQQNDEKNESIVTDDGEETKSEDE